MAYSDIEMFAVDSLLIEEEYRRIDAQPAQGEQSIMVQLDTKKWAKKEGLWPRINYYRIIEAHAEDRGWSQEGFTGLEMPHATDS
jgi:hypothetical protein